MPTVKSSEASNASRARSMSSIVWSLDGRLRGPGAPWHAASLGQIEVERVEQVDRRARGVDRHVRRHLHERLGVVEDDLHARLDEVVGHALSRLVGHGEHAHHDVLLVDHLLELVVAAHPQLGAFPDGLADLARVGVEDRDHPEAVVGEDVGACDRLAEVAGAEQRDVVLAAGAQDLADLRDERVDVVADAALAELAEARQVAPDLRRVDVGVVGELLRGDRVLAHLLGLGQDLEIAREPRGDAERQPFAATLDELHTPTVELLVKAHPITVSSNRSSSAASTKYSNASVPATVTTGMRSP